MTREEAIKDLHHLILKLKQADGDDRVYEHYKEVIETLQTEPCEDCVSRQSIKKKLQEHHDFFIKAYGGFKNLPLNDKSRVDEISSCIAMVVNEPSVHPEPFINKPCVSEQACHEDKVKVLEKIRADITAIAINGQVDEHTLFVRTGEQVKQMTLDIVDKYMAESEGKE